MTELNRPTIGLALSGSGNRSTFYLGFLEVLNEKGIKVDYISCCSGGSIIASAYACNTMEALKKFAFTSTKEDIKKLIIKSKSGGGYYSFEKFEEELRTLITKGATFEEVQPKMAFVAVDIDSGEKVSLCMGDIAKAACVSSAVPGLIEPTQWGNHTLVDGGILTIVPLETLYDWKPDISIGINLRSTKHIFSNNQITLKKTLNFLKKILFIEEIESWFNQLFPLEQDNENQPQPSLLSVWAKSLDLVIKTSKLPHIEPPQPDLMILPDFPRLKRSDISQNAMTYHYEVGRKCALEYLPQIEKLIAEKQPILNKAYAK